ncbi:fibronectin type III domain-containing protein [uncultured Fluviicola sp.]|uniref:fibronectin type III domain-containing protein n=1 Tax=uncultured Fluviicola sp. TaxID=463303 RepID=UPI00260056FD|nr:fibronectin type III domain-containing protein [uncultured Fluviicola sp.]
MRTGLYLTLFVFLVLTACKKKDTTKETQTSVNACGKPTNLNVFAIGPDVLFEWDDPNIPGSGHYQFEYGLTGFSHGSGTTLITPNKFSANISMSAGNTYEFYVRGYCDATGGYSEWAGPFSFYSNENHNLCLSPGNVQYTIEYNALNEPVGANMTWNHNGESIFECVMVSDGANPDNGNIQAFSYSEGTPTYSLTQNTEYDFYVRANCKNGDTPNWIGPKNVNIGG